MRRGVVAVVAALAVVAAVGGVMSATADPLTPAPIIENVPGDAVYQLHDSAGHTMDTAKVVADPTTPGRYLAVYHWGFSVGVATSTDLRTWTYRRTLDTAGSQPTLAFSPAPKNGPILAMEGKPSDSLRFRYWTTVSGMLGTSAPYINYEAPKTLSTCAEGTPSIRSVTYASSSSVINSGSTIVVSHHYYADCQTDREAVGTLKDFKTWTTAPDTAADTALSDAGAVGKHGDRDQFSYGGQLYSVYEGAVGDTMSDWRLYLYDGTKATRLDLHTPGGSQAFANPSVTNLVDPAGHPILLVSTFLPSEVAGPGEAGQLLYWNRLDADTPSPTPSDTATPTPSPSPTDTASPPPDPVIAAVGDIACAPGGAVGANCQHKAVSDKILADTEVGNVLVLGDNQYDAGSLSAYQNAYDPTFGRFKSRTRPVPGNHEYATANASGYYTYFGALAGDPAKGYYSYDVGAWHFLAINSEKDTGAQLAWVKADLAAHPNQCVAAYWHKPRFSTGGHGNNSYMAPFFQALYDGHADLVMAGHDHDYERFAQLNPNGARDDVNGMVEIVSGEGGKNHYSVSGGPTTLAKDNTGYGYTRLTLHANSADGQFVSAVGTYTDTYTVPCH